MSTPKGLYARTRDAIAAHELQSIKKPEVIYIGVTERNELNAIKNDYLWVNDPLCKVEKFMDLIVIDVERPSHLQVA